MGSIFPDAPAPPNPIQVAGAQTASNVSTAVANAFLNNTSQITPEGAMRYDPTGSYQWTDPTSNFTYNIPTFTATQTLSPTNQYIQGLNNQTKTNVASLGVDRSQALYNQLSQNMNIAGAPAAGNSAWFIDNQAPQFGFADVGPQQTSLGNTGAQQTSFADVGQQQGTFGQAGDITRSYGPGDFSADRANVEQALYGRLNPQLGLERSNLEQRLADQGIRYGSQAYTNAMDDYNRMANDARLAVTQTAGTEQARMMNMAAQRAGFENAAQQQAYQQALGRGQFANQAQQTMYEQMLGRGQFANEAQKQAFAQALQGGTFANAAQAQNYQQTASRAQFYNAAAVQEMARDQAIFGAYNTARQQWLDEQFALRNQPLNEISALMSGSQIAQPKWVSTPQTQMANTDYGAIVNSTFKNELDAYKQNSANFNNLMGGIFGAMGGVMSDRRMKENVDKVGTIFAAGPDGEKPLPIYEYSYKHDPASTRHIGPMAQDVEQIDRSAVKKLGGVKYIDKTKMGSILRAA